MSEEVEKWLKRTERKGPYYLVEKHKPKTILPYSKPGMIYTVIWNDGPKTKLGLFQDGMYCRYGVQTHTVLNGETSFDLWNGAGLTDELFKLMLEVRKGESTLPHFNPRSLKKLQH